MIKDDNFVHDYQRFKHVLSDIKFEVNVVYWKWTGKWLPSPAFMDAILFRLPDVE